MIVDGEVIAGILFEEDRFFDLIIHDIILK